MFLTKLKWMAVGVLTTCIALWLYNHRDSLKSLSGSNYNAGMVSQVNPEFASYIHAFTTGYISSGSTIKIRLAGAFAENTPLNTPLKENYFSFEPSLEGETVWKDAQTLEFKPKERLKPGQLYKATFQLDKLVDVKKELKEFEFSFRAIEQSVQLQAGDLKSYNGNDFEYYSLTGNLATADFADPDLVERALTATMSNHQLSVKWLHNEKGTSHKFLIDSIQRPVSSEEELKLTCDAKDLKVSYNNTQKLTVPQKSVFTVLNVKTTADNEQCVLINFSNPISESQSLEGLINASGLSELKYIVNGNQVMLYPAEPKPGSYAVKISELLKDAHNTALGTATEHNVVFHEIKPAVRFLGNGTILPSTNGLSMPFETVNLRAVDVKVIKIYENNVLQFLQNNDMDGGSELAHVGKEIAEKRINLGISNPADFTVWKKFSLDLGSLIKSEPGAIYRVVMNFKKSYSTYSCLGNNIDDKFEMEEIKEPKEEEEVSYYYYGNDYESGDEGEEEEYHWADRNDPCKAAYYQMYDRAVARNILASDLGFTVKKGNDGSLFMVVSDLISTKPLSGVSIELYDYQKQLIQTVSTNSDGQVFISPQQKPYLLVAKKDRQRAYLKLDNGNSLSLSMYDVSGDAVKKGVKGFIYGERGVWRPGDTLFLNFILEDKQGAIPANHPVAFDLYNPQGQLYKRLISTKSVDGFYSFTTATDKNAPTGLWNAEVKVGAVKFSKNIRIETIMPNRLKIDVHVGDDKLLQASKENRIRLYTAWLTGAEAHNLSANISVALTSATTEFPKFEGYTFDDPRLRFEAQNNVVFDGRTNDHGDVNVPLQLSVQKNVPGFLKASFSTQVFEPGGAFSVDRFSVLYSPYNFYVGVKLPEGEKNSGIIYTGKDQFINVATVDAKGNPVSRGNLKFELYKLEWSWWWDQYRDDVANYESDEYHKPVESRNFSSQNGTAKLKVNVNESDWGRYLIRIIDLDGGHSTAAIAYFDWSNWMERNGGDSKIVANMLSFTSDKPTYKSNDEVTITIPSPQNGRALVTIENGSHVLEAHWLETEKGSTVFKFKATPQMAPNIYVHVSLMQPHARTNDLPIRLYGVLPITINDPESHLKPVIKMPATLVPEQNVTINVSEENDREMAFTLAVVDEGLLDITRFKTPDPYSTFYAKEALGVKTWDVYDNVIGAFGAELERVLSIGGDGSELNKDGAKANRFKPMVKCFGPFHLNKGGKKSITFKMPMYVGAVRTMLIAGNKGAYGFAEASSQVKAPLMILGTLPRVLSVTEDVKLPVSVFGGDKNIGPVTVKVEVNGLLQTVSGNVKTVSVSKNDEKLLTFDLKVKNVTGIAKVKISANGGGYSSVYDMELDVRNPNPYQVSVKDSWMDAGKSISDNINTLGLPGTNSGVVELSTTPPINLEERLRYLITYPHGCVEQTTSQTFAQLYLPDILELSAEKKADIEANIRHGISELSKFQLTSGAMSYWQGISDVSDWGTSYAGHFLLAAEKKGYTLPSGFKKSWIAYQQTTAQNFEINASHYFNTDELQAYRLYVLAFANSPVLGAMNRLREFPGLSPEARWLLAGAYVQAGQIDEAEKLIANTSMQISPYKVDYYTYGSSERDEAIVLQTLCQLNKKQQAFMQFKKIAAFLSSNEWLSTQTTAFGLIAAADFIKKFGSSSAMQAQVSVNGKAREIKGASAISQLPIDFSGTSNIRLNVNNNGKGVLYVRVVNRGKPAIGDEKEANENISVDVAYRDMRGNGINPSELEQGANFMMSVTVRNFGLVGEIKNLALTSYIPSGWEIHNARMDNNEEAMKNTEFTYQDVRDDKVLTYFDLKANESKTFNLLLNASYEGRFYLPSLNVEAMYDNRIYAYTKGQWIRVQKAGAQGVAGK